MRHHLEKRYELTRIENRFLTPTSSNALEKSYNFSPKQIFLLSVTLSELASKQLNFKG